MQKIRLLDSGLVDLKGERSVVGLMRTFLRGFLIPQCVFLLAYVRCWVPDAHVFKIGNESNHMSKITKPACVQQGTIVRVVFSAALEQSQI